MSLNHVFRSLQNTTQFVVMSYSPFLTAFIPDLEANADLDQVFTALMSALGHDLDCDRCFLYLRHPSTRLGRVPYCWRRSAQYPEIYDPEWKLEPSNLAQDDPMFAAALATADSIFVENVDTAPEDVLNRAFEREQFGHRALIHAHLCWEGQLWGILQPCVFNYPRVWSRSDRHLIRQVVDHLTPLAVTYVQLYAPSAQSATRISVI